MSRRIAGPFLLAWLTALSLVVLASCRSTPAETARVPAVQATARPSATPPPTPSPTPPAAATPGSAPTMAPAPTAVEVAPTRPAPEPFAGGPLSGFHTYGFVGSGECAVCHSGLVDEAGQDVSMDAHWRSTMMANAAKDPLWQAKVSSEVARHPALQEVIESKCATCHMPMAYTQASMDGQGTTMLGDGFLSAENPLHAAAMDGVSCTLCHQVQDTNLGQKESWSGAFAIDTSTAPPDRLIYGPYPDPLQQQMQMRVGYLPVEGAHVRDPGLCATCHTLYTPYVDAAGNVVGTFPEQTPYLEWAHSDYGDGADWDISCQQCHMPTAEGAVRISNRPGGRMLQAREPFGQHHFVGGNAFMIDVFRTVGLELGLTAGTTHLDATLARTLERLETGAAQLTIERAQVADGTLTAVIRVTSIAGHKLPTGFPSRRAWIHLTVTDGDGAVVLTSGEPQADGSIAGSDADTDAAAYEPHYERIEDAEQVQIYESVMQDTDGAVTYTLLRGASYVKDNRLLPNGFDPATADADIAVYGAAARDADFGDGSDRVTYEIDLGAHGGPYTVSAELLYQAVSYRFAVDLQADDTALVARWQRAWDAADRMPVVMASAEQVVR